MDFVLAKVNDRKARGTDKFKVILTNETLFTETPDLSTATTYSPETLLDSSQWFKLENFASTDFCIPLISEQFKDSIEASSFSDINISEIHGIKYICSCQSKNILYFQRVPKAFVAPKTFVRCPVIGSSFIQGNKFKVYSDFQGIQVNAFADAMYHRDTDILYFRKLENITTIFNGINELFRAATQEETNSFLEREFISLATDFNKEKVSKSNRRLIALAVPAFEKFSKTDKERIFSYTFSYCPELATDDNKFAVNTDKELEKLMYGILERYYTTDTTNEKRIANSIKRVIIEDS